MTPKVINLDTIQKSRPVELVVDGTKHKMKESTVEDFIENMKLIDALGVKPTPAQEIEVMIAFILRAFPTLKNNQVRKMTMQQLRMLSDLARGENGEIATDDETEITKAVNSGNDQKAD